SREVRAWTRPTIQTDLAHKPRDRSSRSLQPSLPEARLRVALDAADQARSDVFARVYSGRSQRGDALHVAGSPCSPRTEAAVAGPWTQPPRWSARARLGVADWCPFH